MSYSLFYSENFHFSNFQHPASKIFDIWWSTFDITDDFKPISKMFFSCFGEIKQSLFFLFSSNIIL